MNFSTKNNHLESILNNSVKLSHDALDLIKIVVMKVIMINFTENNYSVFKY